MCRMIMINKILSWMYNKNMKTIKKSFDSSRVLKTFREVSLMAKDNLKQSLAVAKLKITSDDMNMIYQLIDSSLDNAWSNSENTIKRLLEEK
jgi:hypothetical protein